jgi:uncharacterized protein YprB with RNaseH-like and TPR domain
VSTSRLAERLREIVKTSVPGATLGFPPDRSLHQTLDRSAYATLEEGLGGEWREHAGGRCFVVEQRMEPFIQYGRMAVGEIAAHLEREWSHVPMLGSARPAEPSVTFFDLETTGLNGGAGTVAFLVGIGRFGADRSFSMQQYVLTGPAGERHMLGALDAELTRTGALVSFNGRSFDAPLLETRYSFHRLEWKAARLPHLDMLHPARRFWGAAECSLGTLERHVLGAPRSADISSFEIPGRYFQFLRTGDARPLAPVLAHNRLDLLALAALTAALLRLIASGPAAAVHPREALALGRAYIAAGLDSLAKKAYCRAIELASAGADPVRISALRDLARGERRWRRHTEAAACWSQILDLPDCPPHIAREAAEALAIHHEHRMRDLAAARQFALRSLEGEVAASSVDAGRHRLARIERKIKRTSRFSVPPLFPSWP